MTLSKQLFKKYIGYVVLILILGYLAIRLYHPLMSILFPFAVSLVAAYLLSPLVSFFMKRKISKFLSIVLTYILVLIILLLGLSYLIPILYRNLSDLFMKMPYFAEKYEVILNEMIIRYEFSDIPDSIKQGITRNLEDITRFVNTTIQDILGTFTGFISNIFFIILVPIITFYLLKDSDYLKRRLAMTIPRKYRDDAVVTWYQIDLVLKRFIRGELIVASILGSMTALGMFLIGVKYPLILGFFAGITNVIPYVGLFLGAIPTILIALAQSPVLALKAIVIFLVVQQIEAGIISPKIVGESVGLHPITIIFVILLSEQLFGVLGMFFAVPVTSIIVVIFNRIISKLTQGA